MTRPQTADPNFISPATRFFLILAVALMLKDLLAGLLILLSVTLAQAPPRMISYGYPNCLACHVSVQGRGLLNTYGRGIEIAQSYSKKDLTAILFGRTGDTEDPRRFDNVLADFILASSMNQRIDSAKTDHTL